MLLQLRSGGSNLMARKRDCVCQTSLTLVCGAGSLGPTFEKLLITLTPYKIVEAEFEVCTVHVAFQICTE